MRTPGLPVALITRRDLFPAYFAFDFDLSSDAAPLHTLYVVLLVVGVLCDNAVFSSSDWFR